MPIAATTSALATATQAEPVDPMDSPEFQQLFVRTLLGEVSKSMPEGSLLSGDLEMFGDVLLDELAAQLSATGAMLSGGANGIATHVEHFAFPIASQSAVFPVSGRLSSAFGSRRDPIEGHDRHHAGMDIAAPTGTKVRAALSGTVVSSGRRGGYGNTVVVEHADGTQALYAHCSRLDVQTGDPIRAGQTIAAVGSTGRSTGPHLHFELRVNGEAVDPESRLSFRKP
ncbi:MAG: murein DD-endopeptidase MepM/ murein hydrolase activator NlpD [Myxococcota bacterium]